MTANRLPPWLVPFFLVGGALALTGGYWDDAWHTHRGRDSFFIAPHIAIYSGVTLAGAALGVWTLLVARVQGARAALRHRPLVMAVASVALTLASAPIDNAWHEAFGRDAVIWSPPHLLGIVGTSGLAIAVLAALSGGRGVWERVMQGVAGAMVLAGLTFLVVEYETDVPQFDEVWYLPALTMTSALALAIVRLATPHRLAATQAAALHLAFLAGVSAFLLLVGFEGPQLPLLLVPALVLDLAASRRRGAVAQAGAYTLALFTVYVPVRNLLGGGVRLDAADVLLGMGLAFIAVLLVLGLVRRPAGGPPARTRLASAALLGLAPWAVAPAPAIAHDPGQGQVVGTVDLSARVRGDAVAVVATPHVSGEISPAAVVARRAGVVRRDELRRSGLTLRGSLELPQAGRWFVYVRLRRGRETIESWFPVKAGTGQRHFAAKRRFAYVVERKPSSTAIQWIAGAALYLLAGAFLVALVVLVRRAAVGSGTAGVQTRASG